jgi:hypothetical protein
MRRAAIGTAAAVGAIALVAALGLAFREGAGAKRDLTGTKRELDELRAELARLSEEQASSRLGLRGLARPAGLASSTALDEPAAPPPSEGSAKTSGADGDKLTDEERSHRLQVLNEARLDLCRTRHTGESYDPQWSEPAAKVVRGAFAQTDLESAQLSIDCRTTVCRVDFKYAADQPLPPRGLHAVRIWPGRRYWKADIERREGTMFLAREGYELPAVDEASLQY